MTAIYEFESYKDYVRKWISSQPKAGRGELSKMARFLGVHSTMMSHVFKRHAHLSEEQACELCEYLGLDHDETSFFLQLVQLEKAGSEKLKAVLRTEVKKQKEKWLTVSSQVKPDKELSDEKKAIFYSSWHYSAVRLLSNLPKSNTLHSLKQQLGLPLNTLNKMLRFLTDAGIIEETDGKFRTLLSKIHVSSTSPFIWKHHQNWRVKAMERYQQISDDELFFTSPLTINSRDIAEVKKKILKLIQEVSQTVEKSDPDTLCCLNIDWVKLSTPQDEA